MSSPAVAEPALHRGRLDPRKHGHPVVGLLAVDRGVVAEGLEGQEGEGVVRHLQLLQAQHVRPGARRASGGAAPPGHGSS